MTALDLDHAPDCPTPSTYYAIRNGTCWLACRRCGASTIRLPATQGTRP